MQKYFESLDGYSIIPFSKVVRIRKNDTDKRFVIIYTQEQFSNNIHCSYEQLADYLYWLDNKDSVKSPNE